MYQNPRDCKRFCPLIMTAGRPRQADPGELYGLATHFYWELRNIDQRKRKTALEGLSRAWVDRKNRARLLWEARKAAKLSAEAEAELRNGVERQIHKGFLAEEQRETFIRGLIKDIESQRRFGLVNAAKEQSQKRIPISGEPEIIDDLLSATTPYRIREICADAFQKPEAIQSPIGPLFVTRPNWPISSASKLPGSLAQYASQFIAARKHPRFPKSDRPTSRKRKLWFLSRALAGAVCGIQTRTAMNLISSVRPDEAGTLSKVSKRTRQSRNASRASHEQR